VNFVRKSLFPLAGLAAILLIITIASPRALRAVVATLVQVVNTPTSAVPVVQAPAASQLYENSCTGTFGGGVTTSCSLPAVPAGQTLFIESVSFSSVPVSGSPAFTELYNVSSGAVYLYVPMLQQPAFGFTGTVAARTAFPAGQTPGCSQEVNAPSTGSVTCLVFGYLAPAQ
jgi:hypothetical protein